MSEISALPSSIVEWLEGREDLDYIKFLTEFPPIKKAVPLKKTTVAVGIKGMKIVDSFVENDEGVLVKNEYCRKAEITLRLSIHAPLSSGGAACHEAFTDIIDCLTFDSALDIVSSGCENITADRDTDAFVLSAWLTVNASLCPAATSSLDFPSFLSKDLLCGSHISNSDIHLSPEQQAKLDTPYQLGTYFGTGDSTQSVTVGFRPSRLLVFANGLPLFAPNGSTGKSYALCGAAFGDYATLGVTLTEKGFKVSSTESLTVRSCSPLLNDLGTTYAYAAFR